MGGWRGVVLDEEESGCLLVVLFHSFNIDFKAFNFAAKIKLEEPLKLSPSHHNFKRSLKPSTFSHIFSNLKREGTLLRPLPSKRTGKWLDTGLGKTHCIDPLKRQSHPLFTKNQPSLDI